MDWQRAHVSSACRPQLRGKPLRLVKCWSMCIYTHIYIHTHDIWIILNTFTVFFSVTEISVRNWWAQFIAFSREAPVPMVSLVRGPCRGLVAMHQTSGEKARIAGLLKGWWWFYSLKSSREGGLLNFHEVVIDKYSRKTIHMQRCECPNFCRYFLVHIFTIQFATPPKLAHDDS